MDQENVFSRLRRLAHKVENELNLFQERMQNPPDQRVASGASANNILKEMQIDAHRLKSDASKELTKQQESNSFQDVLTACENLIGVNQRRCCSLKEYLIQYGYEPVNQQTKPTSILKSSSEYKENTEQDGVAIAAVNDGHSPNEGPSTPPRDEASSLKCVLDNTPQMEDFGLSMNRVNFYLKKDVPTPSQKVLDVSYADRYASLNATAEYQNSNSELNHFSSETQAPLPSCMKQHSQSKLYLQPDKRGDHLRPDSVEPKSPNITSRFLQDHRKPPVEPMVSLIAESFTPPTPDCQATEMLSVMPQEPKRLLKPVEKAEPQEPDQTYREVENITPELPPSLSDSAYRGKLSSQKEMTTPVNAKRLPSHLAFLQAECTPKTPEFTMSLKQMCSRPIPSFQHDYPVNQVGGTYGKTNDVTDLQTPSTQKTFPQRPPCVYIAPITESEFSSLSSRMRQNLSIEKVNSWIKIIDTYIADKPMGEKILSSKDVESLHGYPWLRALLLLMVSFKRLDRIADGDDVVFIPTAVIH